MFSKKLLIYFALVALFPAPFALAQIPPLNAEQQAAFNGLAPLAKIPTGAGGNQGFWDANRNQTNAIANGTSNIPFLVPFAATPSNTDVTAQEQSILDAPYTRPNLYQLADGFGSKLGPLYQGLATWKNSEPYKDASAQWTAVSRNVTNIIWFTGARIRDANGDARDLLADNSFDRTSYPNYVQNSYPGAQTNVYGAAYGLAPNTNTTGPAGTGPYNNGDIPGYTRGNPRPFQVLPGFNQSIPLFEGANFNDPNLKTNNWQYITGPYSSQYTNPSYPSGHAAYGVYGGLLLGMLIPERFTEMNTRGVENALGRVVLGAHWTADMIGSRTLAYYEMAQMFAGTAGYDGSSVRPIPAGNTTQMDGGSGQVVTVGGTSPTYQQLFQRAYNEMRSALTTACGSTIANCVQGDTSRFSNKVKDRAFYEANLTLNLPVVYTNQTARYDFNSDPLTKNAGYLLQTRFPYLSLSQATDVITSTQGSGGGFLDDGSAFGRYSRINLVAAADGYATFDKDVIITMDAARAVENPFFGHDTWSNNISGNYGLTLNGTGLLELTGNNTYIGDTRVNGGELKNNGTIAGNVIVEAAGNYSGAGTILGNFTDNGQVSPGNSIGNERIYGNMSLGRTATYNVEYDTDGRSDKIIVGGSASINGHVLLVSGISSPSSLLQKKFNILSANQGINGQFSGISSVINYSFLTPYLNYDRNNAYFGFNLTPFSVVSRSINQRNVGNALTMGAYGPISGPGANILNTLFYGSYQSAQSVMDTVGGAGLAGVQTTAMEVGQMVSSTVSDQIAFWRSGEENDITGVTLHENNGLDRARSFMAYSPTDMGVTTKSPITIKGPVAGLASPVPPARTYRAWGSMFGGGANFLSDSGRGTPSATAGYYGGLLGVDYQLTPNALVGVSLGGSSAGFSVGSLSTTGSLTGFHAGLYGSYTMGASYLALNETFSAYSNKTNRSAGGYSFLPYESLTANFGSTEFRTRLEGGHSLLMGGLKATPFVAAEIAAYNVNGFSERSSLLYQSSLALKNNGQAINSLPTFVGLRLSNAYTLENGWRLAPIGSLAYVHEFFPQRQFTNILMSMPGQDFNVAGPRSTYNLVQTKLGAQLFLNKAFALYSDFQGEFSSMSQSYGGTAGMKYYW